MASGGLADREAVENAVKDHDVVVHLAARPDEEGPETDPWGFLEINVGGTMNVLEAVRETGARMVFGSGSDVYGKADGTPVSEDAQMLPHSPAAASMVAADRMCFAYHRSFGLDVTILRPGIVYGGQHVSGRGGPGISEFARLAASGKPLRVSGSGKRRYDYIHIEDMADAYDLVLKRTDLSGEALNVGSGATPSIKQIAEYIGRSAGVEVVNEPELPGEAPGVALDSSKIRALGFEPRVDFWGGLSDYLEQSVRGFPVVT